MGGIAGHLAHLQENLDFTFGELKGILGSVAVSYTHLTLPPILLV